MDRNLKAKYLLNSCPNLKKLTIDWQEELSLPPINQYSPSWFTYLVQNDQEWPQLCSKLTHLEVSFPAAYNSSAYSLSIFDANNLFPQLFNLLTLKLVGAGKDAPIHLLYVLQCCQNLSELHLEKSYINVPGNYDVSTIGYL